MTPELVEVLNRARTDLTADEMESSCRDWIEQIVRERLKYPPDPPGDDFLKSRLSDFIYDARVYLNRPDDFHAIAYLEPILEAWAAIRTETPTFERDWQRFENTTGDRRAFWAIRVTGGEYELHWGRICSKGQRWRKPYLPLGDGLLQSLIDSKLRRGYEPATALMRGNQPRPAYRVAWWHRDGELLPRRGDILTGDMVYVFQRQADAGLLAVVQCRRCGTPREAIRGRSCTVLIEGSKCGGELVGPEVAQRDRRGSAAAFDATEAAPGVAARQESLPAAEQDSLKALAESMAGSLLGTARFQQLAAPVVEIPAPSLTCGCKACNAKVHCKDTVCTRCHRLGCNEEWVGCERPI